MNYYYNFTNLSLAEKRDHFDSILKFCHNNVSDESSHDETTSVSTPTDLTLRAQDSEGKFVSVNIHCAMLCSQSSYLQSLIESNTSDAVIILPEVCLMDIKSLLDILYSGKCYASKEDEKFRLVRLLISLGLDNIARNLWIQTVPRSSPKLPEKPEEKRNPEPLKSAQLECKRCFKHFPSEDLLKFFMHEKKCSSKKEQPAPVHQIPPGITPLKDIEKVNARKTPKITKACPVCNRQIAGSGSGWKYPLYAHLSRKHFSEQLSKDYLINGKCKICGKEENSFSGSNKKVQLILHLGTKHKLIENYVDVKDFEEGDVETLPKLVDTEIEDDGDHDHDHDQEYSPPRKTVRVAEGITKGKVDQIKDEIHNERDESHPEKRNVRSRSLPKRFQLTEDMGHRGNQTKAKNEADFTESDCSPVIRKKQRSRRSDTGVPCPHCGKVVAHMAVLYSHFLSKHFRPDCETGIRQILTRTGGRCSLCPGKKFVWTGELDWKILLHFSRTHKICDGLHFSDNLPNEKNLKLIMKKFFPDDDD